MDSTRRIYSTARTGARTVAGVRGLRGQRRADGGRDGGTDDPQFDRHLDGSARGLARPGPGGRAIRTARRGGARPRGRRSHRRGVDRRSGPDRSRGSCRTDARERATPSAAVARAAVRRRDPVTDDGPAVHSSHAAGRRPEAEKHRLHVGDVLHVHAAEAAATRARPRAGSPQPDRPVAALASSGRGAHTDRRLGPVDPDIARGPSAADGDRPRCVALAHRPGDALARSARSGARRR